MQHIIKAEYLCIADYIPIVISKDNQELIGTIRTENLIKYFRNELKLFHKQNEEEMPEWKVKLNLVSEIASFLDEEVNKIVL